MGRVFGIPITGSMGYKMFSTQNFDKLQEVVRLRLNILISSLILVFYVLQMVLINSMS